MRWSAALMGQTALVSPSWNLPTVMSMHCSMCSLKKTGITENWASMFKIDSAGPSATFGIIDFSLYPDLVLICFYRYSQPATHD